MNFSVERICEVLGQKAPDGIGETEITGWSIDSRTIQPGDLFFALRGPNFDGNAFVDQAIAKGADAVIAECAAIGPVICVPDTLKALQTLASWARTEWGGDVIAVTGSAGKTSTKDIIAALLASAIPVGKTTGNFNNEIGLPLSLLRMPDEARVAVVEIGMNHAGEIRELAKIARPDTGVVTNVGYAHIENFEDVDAIAAAKRELIEALPPDGTAVLNADDARVVAFAHAHAGRTITYGVSKPADIRADNLAFSDAGSRFRIGATRFETRLSGRHAVLNILAGIAVASTYGLKPAALTDAVRELAPGKMRGETLHHNDILILNDCYNSNPDAVRSMIDVLRDTPAERRIAVLGEMLELGHWSEPLHREIGSYVAGSGISVLVGIRGAARHMVDAATKAGLAVDAAYFFPDPESAGDQLREIARGGDAILFKGSRGTHVEKALERFLA